jgi:hypothetical protein
MKKTITTVTLLAGALSGYSQGQIEFNTYSHGKLSIAIFNTQSPSASTYAVTYAGSTVYEEVGNTSIAPENPQGTTSYTGPRLSGAVYDIQLFAGPAGITSPGGNVNGVGLIPVSSIFNFHTTAALAGFMSGSQALTLPTEPYFAAARNRVWR